jgi:hypothetical protein
MLGIGLHLTLISLSLFFLTKMRVQKEERPFMVLIQTKRRAIV